MVGGCEYIYTLSSRRTKDHRHRPKIQSQCNHRTRWSALRHVPRVCHSDRADAIVTGDGKVHFLRS